MGRPLIDLRTATALLGEWVLIAGALYVALYAANAPAFAFAFAVIATRQHGLLMLYHDAVHGLLARGLRLNDFLINLLVGVPHLLPIELYRPLHLAHHSKLGTADDPERRLLYAGQPWRYQPLAGRALLRQLLGDLLVVNGARTLSAWSRHGGRLRIHPLTLLPVALWLVAIGTALWIAPKATAICLLLWFAPLLTLTNLLQKLRSFAEHSGGPGVTPGWPDWTYSWRAGLLGRLTIWPYHINRHREHHANPQVPWHRLPALAATAPEELQGSQLGALLLRRANEARQ